METIFEWFIKQNSSEKGNISIIVAAVVFPSTFYFLMIYPSYFFELPFLQTSLYLMVINVSIVITGTFFSILSFAISLLPFSFYLIPKLDTIIRHGKRENTNSLRHSLISSSEAVELNNIVLNNSDESSDAIIGEKVAFQMEMKESIEKMLLDFTSLTNYIIKVCGIYLLSSIQRTILTIVTESPPELTAHHIFTKEAVPHLLLIIIVSFLIHFVNAISLTRKVGKLTQHLNSGTKISTSLTQQNKH